MYRVAIIENDPDVREQIHKLVIAFFAENQENAAFVICTSLDELPRYYDCYLVGDGHEIKMLCGGKELSSYGTIAYPPQAEEFFALLNHWRQSAPKTTHVPKRKVGEVH
ncbi:MAG: hypothetical protein RRY64_01580 [Oscillospiraceae bacterium]